MLIHDQEPPRDLACDPPLAPYDTYGGRLFAFALLL